MLFKEKIQDDLGETFLMAISLSRLYSLAIRSVQRHKKANVDIISRQVSTVEMVICRNIFKSIPLTLSLEPRPSTSTENCVQCMSVFPDGPVVEGLPTDAEDMGSIPGLGRSHVPCTATNRAHARDPVSCNKRSHCNEEPDHCNKEQPRLTAIRESPAQSKEGPV
ncbi:hypothetical protein MJT46_017281 [Ovis ammon polii x Ovis aries]|nr:hypothetical protein MJT46_017281 [Ovis ammon polii x Ovis aries]